MFSNERLRDVRALDYILGSCESFPSDQPFGKGKITGIVTMDIETGELSFSEISGSDSLRENAQKNKKRRKEHAPRRRSPQFQRI